MMSKAKKKKDKAYATKKGRLSYEDDRLWARLGLDSLVLHSGPDKEDPALFTIMMSGCMADRMETYIQVTDSEGQEFDLVADDEGDAEEFDAGITQNAELWERGDADVIKKGESHKKDRRERRKSVLEAVAQFEDMSDETPPQSPRETSKTKISRSQSADYERKPKKESRKRRPSTLAETAAADAARLAREEEEDSLQENELEMSRLQGEVKEKEEQFAEALARKGQSVERAKERIMEELAETFEAEMDELRTDISAQQKMIDEGEIREAELEEQTDELTESAVELESLLEEKIMENEELQESLGGGSSNLTSEQRAEKVAAAERQAKTAVEEEIAADLAKQIESMKAEQENTWTTYIAEKVTDLEEKIEAASEKLIEAEELADEAEERLDSGADDGADDKFDEEQEDDLIMAAADKEEEATANIEADAEERIDAIARETKSKMRAITSSAASMSGGDADAIRRQIKDKQFKIEMARMRKDEAQVRLSKETERNSIMDAEVTELQGQLETLADQLEEAASSVTQRIAEESRAAINSSVATIEARVRAEMESISNAIAVKTATRIEDIKAEQASGDESSASTLRDITQRTAEYQTRLNEAKRRADKAMDVQIEAEEKIDTATAALGKAKQKLDALRLSGAGGGSDRSAAALQDLQSKIAAETKLKEQAASSLQSVQSEEAAVRKAYESSVSNLEIKRSKVQRELQDLRREKEAMWRKTFLAVETDLKAELAKQKELVRGADLAAAAASRSGASSPRSGGLGRELQELQSELQRVAAETDNVTSSNASLQVTVCSLLTVGNHLSVDQSLTSLRAAARVGRHITVDRDRKRGICGRQRGVQRDRRAAAPGQHLTLPTFQNHC